MFGGGPVLERDVKQFLLRLESHPDIELLAAFCQSAGQSLADVVANTWQRRRWLAPAVLCSATAGSGGPMAAPPPAGMGFAARDGSG
jgi:hypothetical protein